MMFRDIYMHRVQGCMDLEGDIMKTLKTLYADNREEIEDYIITEYPKEAVLSINKDGELSFFRNLDKSPNDNFKIDSKEFFNSSPQLLIHSHTHENLKGCDGVKIDPRTPSYADMQLQNSINIPMCIVSASSNSVSDPIFF